MCETQIWAAFEWKKVNIYLQVREDFMSKPIDDEIRRNLLSYKVKNYFLCNQIGTLTCGLILKGFLHNKAHKEELEKLETKVPETMNNLASSNKIVISNKVDLLNVCS
ncbi:hypothetical protein vseg_013051 [Gypsophila vaccaria]